MLRLMTVSLLCGLGLWLTGCGTSPTVHYYVLQPADRPDTPVEATGRRLALAAPLLPEYLDRRAVVRYEKDGQLTVLDTHRWGEPLEDAVSRVLAEALRAHTGDTVAEHPWRRRYEPDTVIRVRLTQLEAHGNRLRLAAHWQLESGDTLRTHDARFTVPLDDPGVPVLVKAHSRALDRLARAIAASLDR